MIKKNPLDDIFDYEQDKKFLINLVRSIKHIALVKSIIKYLAAHNDKNVPDLIFEFTRKKYSKGARASILLLLDSYDCSLYLNELFSLFLKDSFNSTWYCYDILKKYLKKISTEDLSNFSKHISDHSLFEMDDDKKQFHELLLKDIKVEINKRNKQLVSCTATATTNPKQHPKKKTE